MTTDTTESAEYRVAIFARVKDPLELSRVFQQVLGTHPTDANIWTRHVPGILNESFTAEQSNLLVETLTGLGMRVSAVRREDIPDLHRSVLVHHARCELDGLLLIELHDHRLVTIPWNCIQMICVGEIPQDITRHYPPGVWCGLSAARPDHQTAIVTPLTPSLRTWIVCQPPYPILCVDHHFMNYEYLGTRRTDSSADNFRQFIQDIADHAPAAFLPESTCAYLEHTRPERYRFPNPDDFLRYATLESLLARQSSSTKVV
jgi:hypothetical protein